jgi:hypothetical protein
MKYFMCLTCKRRIDCYDKQRIARCACGENNEDFLIELNRDGSKKDGRVQKS